VRKALKVGERQGYRMSMDQYLEYPVRTRQDFEALKRRYNPQSPTRYPPYWAEKVKIWRMRDYPLTTPANGAMGFYWNLRQWMGTTNASYVFYDDPQLAHEMMEFTADFVIETLHRALHEVQIDYFSFAEDMAYKAGPLISPALFKEFVFPRLRRVCGFLREHGVTSIWVDSDGNLEPLVPLLLDAGVNCLWPLEATAGMDPVKLREKYGNELALSGGVDKRALTQGKKEIECEVYYKLPDLLEQGGYIPTLDHSVPPNVPLENYLYYLELKQKLLEGKHGA
jgi:uroporphyrinogen decarboxylase